MDFILSNHLRDGLQDPEDPIKQAKAKRAKSLLTRYSREAAYKNRLLKEAGPKPKLCSGMYGPCDDEPTELPTEAMTAYADDDMNKPIWFCERCAKEYEEYWKDRWDEYYSMII